MPAVPAPPCRPVRFAVGLTGGIGSGKSTVADLFAARGADIIDTDVIAHRLTGPSGQAMPAIRLAFGEAVQQPDGALDRAAMRSLIFSDPLARRRLETILHPLIRDECNRQIPLARGAYPMVVVPLLVETGGWRDRVGRVLVVDCEEAEQMRRVMRRNGLPPEQVSAILAAQSTRAQRLAEADDVVFNGAEVAAHTLAAEVDRLHMLYQRLAQGG